MVNFNGHIHVLLKVNPHVAVRLIKLCRGVLKIKFKYSVVKNADRTAGIQIVTDEQFIEAEDWEELFWELASKFGWCRTSEKDDEISNEELRDKWDRIYYFAKRKTKLTEIIYVKRVI